MKTEVPGDAWSELRAIARGNLFTVYLNGRELFQVEDGTFREAGRVGLWRSRRRGRSPRCFRSLGRSCCRRFASSCGGLGRYRGRQGFDLPPPMRNNRAVPHRKQIAVVLLLLAAAAIPQLLWLGAHASGHHEHDGPAEEAAGHDAEWAALAESLVHGHEHGEDVPDHEHHLVPSPVFRPDPPQDLQTPATASLKAPEVEDVPLASARLWRDRTESSSSSPPRLHLLCTLLI